MDILTSGIDSFLLVQSSMTRHIFQVLFWGSIKAQVSIAKQIVVNQRVQLWLLTNIFMISLLYNDVIEYPVIRGITPL